jgi:hypothetical protein
MVPTWTACWGAAAVAAVACARRADRKVIEGLEYLPPSTRLSRIVPEA